MSFIELSNIKKNFDDKEILKGISLSVEKGEFVTFLGPSGCGKTTLLRCLIGLEKINEGNIFIQGEDITKVHPRERGMSMIFQQYCLFPTMTLEDNVSFGLRMNKTPKKEIQQRVERVLDMVNISEHRKKYPYQLSGGEQQRSALARGLVMNPKVLLLDEPFSAIDAKMRKELQFYLRKIHTELNMTSIFVTHDQEEAMCMSDTIHIFNKGNLEQSGNPRDVYLNPKTSFVTEFIGNYNVVTKEISESLFNIKQTIALRPEVIEFTNEEERIHEDYYVISGTVAQVIPQGNVLRYIFETNSGFEFKIDKLFTIDDIQEERQKIFIKIFKKDFVFPQYEEVSNEY